MMAVCLECRNSLEGKLMYLQDLKIPFIPHRKNTASPLFRPVGDSFRKSYQCLFYMSYEIHNIDCGKNAIIFTCYSGWYT
jgi:hypothetical protein